MYGEGCKPCGHRSRGGGREMNGGLNDARAEKSAGKRSGVRPSFQRIRWREKELELCAVPGRSVALDVAAMALQDAVHRGQADA